MAVSVHISAHAARTPLGFGSDPAAAAVRAGISGAAEHPFYIDRMGQPLIGAFDPWIPMEMNWTERLVTLAESVLQMACAPLAAATNPPTRIQIYLALPEIRPGFTREDATVFVNRLSHIGLPGDFGRATVILKGHAGGLTAFATALAEMQHGVSEACLIVGVDSYFHPTTLGWLDDHRQLFGTASRSGFVPGEAGGVCLLATDDARDRLGLPSLGRVLAAATSREPNRIKTTAICLGEGLTATVRAAVGAAVPKARINEIYCDINGERYRSEEWGFVCLREASSFDDPTSYRSPAECWGDVGAASGPLFAMLACRAAARGYAAGPRALLWASSEGGDRSAVVLETGIPP